MTGCIAPLSLPCKSAALDASHHVGGVRSLLLFGVFCSIPEIVDVKRRAAHLQGSRHWTNVWNLPMFFKQLRVNVL